MKPDYYDAKGRPKQRVMNKGNVSEVVKTKPGHSNRHHVLEIMAKLYDWRSIVEVGVWKGGTGAYLLETCPKLKWVGVDPYVWQPGSFDEEGYCDYPGDMNKIYKTAADRVKVYGDRANLIRKSSVEGASYLSGALFDAVFIDGDHRYKHVKEDIAAWRTLVKNGGWLLGHDLNMPSVRKAVNEEFGDNWLELPDVVWAYHL